MLRWTWSDPHTHYQWVRLWNCPVHDLLKQRVCSIREYNDTLVQFGIIENALIGYTIRWKQYVGK